MKAELTILLLLFATTMVAQELTVKSFALDETDLSARTNQVLDANGEPCALVKVGLVIPNATFEGYIVKTVPKTSEYWVYLIDDAREIKVTAPGVLPLEYNFPEPLKKNCTYLLVLKSPQQATAVGKVEMANLKITTEPEDAKVLINGQEEPEQNGFYRLPKGTLEYKVTADMYHEAQGTFNFNEDGQVLNVKLKPAFGALNVTSNPSYASIYIDDVKKDEKTPYKFERMPSGTYRIKVAAGKKYQALEKVIIVKDGETTDADFPLAKQEQKSGATLKSQSVFYIQPSFQVGSLTGIGASVGLNLSGFNIEAGLVKGLGKEEYYAYRGDKELGQSKFDAMTLEGKVGYRIEAAQNFAITPQVGASLLKVSDGLLVENANAISGVAGARFSYNFTKNFGVFAAPYLCFKLSESDGHKLICEKIDSLGKWSSGFNLKLGLSIEF